MAAEMHEMRDLDIELWSNPLAWTLVLILTLVT